MGTSDNKRDLWKVMHEDYEPIPWGWFKFLVGFSIITAWVSSLWFVWQINQTTNSIPSWVYLIVVGVVLGLTIISCLLQFVFNFKHFFEDSEYGAWPFNWLAKYWRRNVVGYRIVHTKCLANGETWARIVSRRGKKVFYTDPAGYVHSDNCKKHKQTLNGEIVSINIPIGGWRTKRIFALPKDNTTLTQYITKWSCRIRHNSGSLASPTLQITDGNGDAVACYLSDSFGYIAEAVGHKYVWMDAIRGRESTEENLEKIEKRLHKAEKMCHESGNLNYHLFDRLGGNTLFELERTSRIGHTQEGLEIKISLLGEMMNFLISNQDLLGSRSIEPLEKKRKEAGEKLVEKTALNEEKKKARAGKKSPASTAE